MPLIYCALILLSTIFNHIHATTRIGINEIWNDDFLFDMSATNGWDIYESIAPPMLRNYYPVPNTITNGDNSQQYHGPFNKLTGGYVYLSRQFRCSSRSNIYVYYSLVFCETGSSDNTRAYPINTDFTSHLQNIGMQVGSGIGFSDTTALSTLVLTCNTIDTIPQSNAWDSKQYQGGLKITTTTTGTVGADEIFLVTFRQRVSAPDERSLIYDLKVECRQVGMPSGITTINNEIWSDDFQIDRNGVSGWHIYSSTMPPTIPLAYYGPENPVTSGDFGQLHHGPFFKLTTGYSYIQRHFMCADYSEVYVYYSFYYCNTGSSDNTRVYPLNTWYPQGDHIINSGMAMGSGTPIADVQLHLNLALVCPQWEYKTKQEIKVSISRPVASLEPWSVIFRQRTSANGEFSLLYNIGIECRVPTVSPTTDPTFQHHLQHHHQPKCLHPHLPKIRHHLQPHFQLKILLLHLRKIQQMIQHHLQLQSLHLHQRKIQQMI
eukprot:415187_1